jgi:hypothetical protein
VQAAGADEGMLLSGGGQLTRMLSVEGSEIAEQLGDMSQDETATLGKIDSLGYQLLSEMFEVLTNTLNLILFSI